MSPLAPLLALHALAAQRGDGLRPELLALFLRHAQSDAGLSASIDPPCVEDSQAPPQCATTLDCASSHTGMASSFAPAHGPSMHCPSSKRNNAL